MPGSGGTTGERTQYGDGHTGSSPDAQAPKTTTTRATEAKTKNKPLPPSRHERAAMQRTIREERDAEMRSKAEQPAERPQFKHIHPKPRPAKSNTKFTSSKPPKTFVPAKSSKTTDNQPKPNEEADQSDQHARDKAEREKAQQRAKNQAERAQKAAPPAQQTEAQKFAALGRDKHGYSEDGPPNDPTWTSGEAYIAHYAVEEEEPSGVEMREDADIPQHAIISYYANNPEGAWFSPETPMQEWKQLDKEKGREKQKGLEAGA